MIDYATGSLPLLQILPLLSNAAIQGDKELKIKQFKQSREIIAARDRKLLAFLGGLDLKVDYINKVEFFLEQENQLINDSINSQGTAYLDISICN